VLVHPSDFEPWALVINEAVACNMPVIATSVVGAAVELVRHRENGLIVAPHSVEALTEAIWELTTGNRCAEMRANCKGILRSWRQAADPVDGMREALRHFGLLWRQPDDYRIPPEPGPVAAVSEKERPIIPATASVRSD
jgi:glycosyltransferase involved in cell wall biosynthesis